MHYHTKEVRDLAAATGMGELQAYRHIQQRKALARAAEIDRRKNSRAFFARFRGAGDSL